MDRKNIAIIAKNAEDKVLLSRLWDRINAGMDRNIMAATGFLSPREQEMARYLFGQVPGLEAFGGWEGAERKLLVYLPDYLPQDSLTAEDSPVVCLHAAFYRGDTPTHRDFLGALMGAGIAREAVGDICVCQGSCDFFVTAQIAPYLLQNFRQAGRVSVQLSQIPLADFQAPVQAFAPVRDTLSSLRLDSVIASGFRMSRGAAAGHIAAGKAAIDGLVTEKPDKPVAQGSTVSLRGFGKIKLDQVNGLTKKGRISVVIHRYL